MNRIEKLLQDIDLKTAVGLEVGALDKPIVPPTSPGIFYIDHLDTQALREKYKADPSVIAANLVEVQGVWGQKTLAEAAASVAPVDFFVASHVIEHVPNLIAWLQEIASILKPDGCLRLAIPDRRYSFDYLRTETKIADVIAPHLVRARIPQLRQVIDHIENVAQVDLVKVWDGSLDVEALVKYHTAPEIYAVADDILKNGAYHDVHCWVFTPTSFALLMARMVELGYHQFACRQFHDTERNTLEFFISMQPVSDPTEAIKSWREMASGIEQSERAADQAEKTQRADRDERIADLEAQAALLGATISALTASTSWRITAPLRALRRAIKI